MREGNVHSQLFLFAAVFSLKAQICGQMVTRLIYQHIMMT